MKREAVLIVSYTFPPDMNIGGKRWYKFAHQLLEDNYEVHVISCDTLENSSTQSLDLSTKNLFVYRIKDNYPKTLLTKPYNLISKFNYKYHQYRLLYQHKGSIYDRSILMEKELQNKMRELIKSNMIRNVFVTCPPFQLSYYATKLKSEIDFFLTIDFRDPWTWGQSYGYEFLNDKRKNYDQQREKFVMDYADKIISPSKSILSHLEKSYPDNSNKCKHIPHGIDLNILGHIPLKTKNSFAKESWKFIYAGTLYDNYDKFIMKLCEQLKLLPTEIVDQFQFDIYALNDFTIHEKIVGSQNLGDKIKFFKAIPEIELFNKIVQYDFSLIYFPEKYKNFVSTKFYELIYCKIPILFVGDKGDLSDFLESNNLGKFIPYDQINQLFYVKMEALKANYNSNYDLSPYDFKTLTRELKSIMNISSNKEV